MTTKNPDVKDKLEASEEKSVTTIQAVLIDENPEKNMDSQEDN